MAPGFRLKFVLNAIKRKMDYVHWDGVWSLDHLAKTTVVLCLHRRPTIVFFCDDVQSPSALWCELQSSNFFILVLAARNVQSYDFAFIYLAKKKIINDVRLGSQHEYARRQPAGKFHFAQIIHIFLRQFAQHKPDIRLVVRTNSMPNKYKWNRDPFSLCHSNGARKRRLQLYRIPSAHSHAAQNRVPQ